MSPGCRPRKQFHGLRPERFPFTGHREGTAGPRRGSGQPRVGTASEVRSPARAFDHLAVLIGRASAGQARRPPRERPPRDALSAPPGPRSGRPQKPPAGRQDDSAEPAAVRVDVVAFEERVAAGTVDALAEAVASTTATSSPASPSASGPRGLAPRRAGASASWPSTPWPGSWPISAMSAFLGRAVETAGRLPPLDPSASPSTGRSCAHTAAGTARRGAPSVRAMRGYLRRRPSNGAHDLAPDPCFRLLLRTARPRRDLDDRAAASLPWLGGHLHDHAGPVLPLRLRRDLHDDASPLPLFAGRGDLDDPRRSRRLAPRGRRHLDDDVARPLPFPVAGGRHFDDYSSIASLGRGRDFDDGSRSLLGSLLGHAGPPVGGVAKTSG
jgi:hypothetical protein